MTKSPTAHASSLDRKDALRSLHIVVADSDPAMQRLYEEVLPTLGHQVCGAGTGRQAVELCRAMRPDLLIIDLELPDLNGLEAAVEVCRDRPLPVVMVSERHDPEVLRRAADSPVLAYLVKPIKPTDLGPAIAVTLHSFARLRAWYEEATRLRQTLEDRKRIERAKGMVMRYSGLDEEEAFYRLKKLASVHNRKLADVAHDIVMAGEVFHQVGEAGEVKKANDGPPRSLRTSRPQRNGSRIVPTEL